ncbi:hypothetical protein CROQUDRAFT_100865, partial [Cronartium quercuum f. sp. fusiforme G11]
MRVDKNVGQSNEHSQVPQTAIEKVNGQSSDGTPSAQRHTARQSGNKNTGRNGSKGKKKPKYASHALLIAKLPPYNQSPSPSLHKSEIPSGPNDGEDENQKNKMLSNLHGSETDSNLVLDKVSGNQAQKSNSQEHVDQTPTYPHSTLSQSLSEQATQAKSGIASPSSTTFMPTPALHPSHGDNTVAEESSHGRSRVLEGKSVESPSKSEVEHQSWGNQNFDLLELLKIHADGHDNPGDSHNSIGPSSYTPLENFVTAPNTADVVSGLDKLDHATSIENTHREQYHLEEGKISTSPHSPKTKTQTDTQLKSNEREKPGSRGEKTHGLKQYEQSDEDVGRSTRQKTAYDNHKKSKSREIDLNNNGPELTPRIGIGSKQQIQDRREGSDDHYPHIRDQKS